MFNLSSIIICVYYVSFVIHISYQYHVGHSIFVAFIQFPYCFYYLPRKIEINFEQQLPQSGSVPIPGLILNSIFGGGSRGWRWVTAWKLLASHDMSERWPGIYLIFSLSFCYVNVNVTQRSFTLRYVAWIWDKRCQDRRLKIAQWARSKCLRLRNSLDFIGYAAAHLHLLLIPTRPILTSGGWGEGGGIIHHLRSKWRTR